MLVIKAVAALKLLSDKKSDKHARALQQFFEGGDCTIVILDESPSQQTAQLMQRMGDYFGTSWSFEEVKGEEMQCVSENCKKQIRTSWPTNRSCISWSAFFVLTTLTFCYMDSRNRFLKNTTFYLLNVYLSDLRRSSPSGGK